MTDNIILSADDTTANEVVTMVLNQIKRERGVYAAYVAEHNVTAETVIDHKNALLALAFPGVKPDGRADEKSPERKAKRFADKVRLGLTTAVAPSEGAGSAETDYLAAIIKACDKGADKGQLSAETILAAVQAHLTSQDA